MTIRTCNKKLNIQVIKVWLTGAIKRNSFLCVNKVHRNVHHAGYRKIIKTFPIKNKNFLDQGISDGHLKANLSTLGFYLVKN